MYLGAALSTSFILLKPINLHSTKKKIKKFAVTFKSGVCMLQYVMLLGRSSAICTGCSGLKCFIFIFFSSMLFEKPPPNLQAPTGTMHPRKITQKGFSYSERHTCKKPESRWSGGSALAVALVEALAGPSGDLRKWGKEQTTVIVSTQERKLSNAYVQEGRSFQTSLGTTMYSFKPNSVLFQ